MKRKSLIFETIFNSYLSGILTEPFSVKDINRFCNNLLIKSPTFISKHCEGNPEGYTEYFKRTSKGKYIIMNQTMSKKFKLS